MAVTQRSSLSEWDVESEFSNFYNHLTIHPWNNLTEKICQELEDDTFKELLFLSREHLGAEYHTIIRCQDNPGIAFFTALEKKYNEHVTEFLVNLFSHTKLHANAGMVNIADKIREYRDIERRYRSIQRPPGCSSNLFGREQLLKDCRDCLMGEDTSGKVGVVLCGLSGMGKTSLAAEVCYMLQSAKPTWEIVQINQRGKTELRELCADLISSLYRLLNPNSETKEEQSGGYRGDSDIDCLRQQARQMIKELCNNPVGKRVLIWLDDMDGQCDSQLEDLCRFLQTITHLMAEQQGQGQTRLLITVARKLGRGNDPVGRMNQRLGGQMKELEVPGLTPTDTEAIMRNVAGLQDKDLTDGVCEKLCKLCCGSPIAIQAVADLLRDGCKVPEIVGYLKCDAPFMNEQLSKCITKSLEKLDIDIGSKECRELLVQLAVFQSAEFDVQDVLAITQDSEGKEAALQYVKDANKAKIMVRLIEFKARHLLEISSQFKKHMKETHTFSLHPLVVKYLQNIINESKDVRVVEEEAKSRFLRYFYQKIQEFTVKQNKSPVRIKFKIEDKWVHIKHFFELLLSDTYCETVSIFDLTPTSHKMLRKSVTVQHSRLWKLAASFLNIEKMKTFAHKQAMHARERRNICGYIYWTCVETENLIQREKTVLAQTVLTNMTSEVGECTGEDVREIKLGTNIGDYEWPPVEVVPVYATYCYTQGKLLSVNKSYNRALDYLNFAESLYEGHVPNVLRSKTGKERIHRREFRSDLARVQNLIGVVHFDKEDYEISRTYHMKAYETIRKELEADVKWHEDYTEYLSNLATTYHQEGLNSKDMSVRQQKFTEALKTYNQCIETDKMMKRDAVYSHGIVLYKRAEIFYLQEDYERAITDQKKALKIMDNKFRPPNINITLCYERMASYLFKLGKEQKKQCKVEEGDNSFRAALDYFDYTLSYIVTGGLPKEHNNHRTYRICKEKHLDLLKRMGKNSRKIDQKYRDFEMGKYDKSIQQNKEDDFDPEELLRQAREEGAELELIPCSDDDSTDSSDESTHSSSSSNGQQSIAVPQRQDSGIDMYRKASMDHVDEAIIKDSSEGMLKMRTDSVLKQRDSNSAMEQTWTDFGMECGSANMAYRDTRMTSHEMKQVEYRVEQRGEVQRPSVRNSGFGGSAEYDARSLITYNADPRRQLVRQSSIDEPSPFRVPVIFSERSTMDLSEGPSRAQDVPQRPASMSVIQHTSQMLSRKRSLEVHQDEEQPGTSMSAEQRRVSWHDNTPTGSGGSADELRLSWRSTGSQDSVITQFRMFTPFQKSISLEDTEDEPVSKKLRTSLEYTEEEEEI